MRSAPQLELGKGTRKISYVMVKLVTLWTITVTDIATSVGFRINSQQVTDEIGYGIERETLLVQAIKK